MIFSVTISEWSDTRMRFRKEQFNGIGIKYRWEDGMGVDDSCISTIGLAFFHRIRTEHISLASLLFDEMKVAVMSRKFHSC